METASKQALARTYGNAVSYQRSSIIHKHHAAFRCGANHFTHMTARLNRSR